MALELEVQELTKAHSSEWDGFVDSSPQGHPFLWREILDAVESSTGDKLLHLGFRKGGELVAGCPLFLLKASKHKAAQSPHDSCQLPYGGLILRPEASKDVLQLESRLKAVVQTFHDAVIQRGLERVRLLQSTQFTDTRHFTWNGWDSRVRYTYVMRSQDNLWDSIESRNRRAIRRAQKAGLDVRASDDVAAFVKLYPKTFEAQGIESDTPPGLIGLVYSILSKKGAARMWHAYTPDGALAAASIFVLSDGIAYGWVGGSDPEVRSEGAPNLLYYHVLEELGEQYPVVDLCGANTPNVARFKAGFNPTLVPQYVNELSRGKGLGKMLSKVRARGGT